MENQKKGLILLTRSIGPVAFCLWASTMLFLALIGADTAKEGSLINQACNLLQLNRSQNYVALSLVFFLASVSVCLTYLFFKITLNKATRNDTEADTKAYSCCSDQIFCSNYSGACSKTIQSATRQTLDHLSIPNIIHCLDDDCTGILGSDRKCSDCGKRF